MSTIDDFVDCICANEYAKKKLIFTNNKTLKNAETSQKEISEFTKRRKESEELYEHTVEQTRPKFKTLASICKKTVMLPITSSGIKNFVEKRLKEIFFYIASNTKSRIVLANTRY